MRMLLGLFVVVVVSYLRSFDFMQLELLSASSQIARLLEAIAHDVLPEFVSFIHSNRILLKTAMIAVLHASLKKCITRFFVNFLEEQSSPVVLTMPLSWAVHQNSPKLDSVNLCREVVNGYSNLHRGVLFSAQGSRTVCLHSIEEEISLF